MPRYFKDDRDWHWPAISTKVKDEADWHCVRCGHIDDKASGHQLMVHRIDGRKENNTWWNLAALCQHCQRVQAKVFSRRVYKSPHAGWFKPYVAGYYAHQLCKPESKEYVLPRVEELIATYMERNARSANWH